MAGHSFRYVLYKSAIRGSRHRVRGVAGKLGEQKVVTKSDSLKELAAVAASIMDNRAVEANHPKGGKTKVDLRPAWLSINAVGLDTPLVFFELDRERPRFIKADRIKPHERQEIEKIFRINIQ